MRWNVYLSLQFFKALIDASAILQSSGTICTE